MRIHAWPPTQWAVYLSERHPNGSELCKCPKFEHTNGRI
jgi:hypothetical protein